MVILDSPGQKRSYSIRDSITHSISNLSLHSVAKKAKLDKGSNELTSLEVLDLDLINNYYYSPVKQFPNISPHFVLKPNPESNVNFKTNDAVHDSTTFTSLWSRNISSRNISLDFHRNSLFIPKTGPPKPPHSFIPTKSDYIPVATRNLFTMKTLDDIDHQDDQNQVKLLRKKSSKKILTRIKTLFSHDKKLPSHVYNKRNDNADFDKTGLDLLKTTKQKAELQQYIDEEVFQPEPKIDNQFLNTIYKQDEEDYKEYQKTKFKRELYASGHFLNFGSNEDLIGSLTFIMDQEKGHDDLIDTDSESSHDTHNTTMLPNDTPDTTHEFEDYAGNSKDTIDNKDISLDTEETIKNIQNDTIGDINVKDDDYSSKFSHEMFVNNSTEEIKQKLEPISKQNSKKDHWLGNLLKRNKSSNEEPQTEQFSSIPALPKLIAIESNHHEKNEVEKLNEKKEIIANNYSDELNTKPEPIRTTKKGSRRVKSQQSLNKDLPATPDIEASVAHQPAEIEPVAEPVPEATVEHDVDVPISTTTALDPPAVIIPEVSEQPKITATSSPVRQKSPPVRRAPPAPPTSMVPQAPLIEDEMVSSGMVESSEDEKQEAHVYRDISTDEKMVNRSDNSETDELTEEGKIHQGNLDKPTSHVASLVDESDESGNSKFGSHQSPDSAYSSSDNDKEDVSSPYSVAEKSNSDTDMEDYNHRIAPAAGTENTQYMNQKPNDDILPSDLQHNLHNMKQQFGTPIHFTGKQIPVDHYRQQSHYNPHQQYAPSPTQMLGYAYSNQQYQQPGAIPPHQQHFGRPQRQTAPPPHQQRSQGYGQGVPANVNHNHQRQHHRPQQSGRRVVNPLLPQHQPPPHQVYVPQQQYQHQYPPQQYPPKQYQPQQYPQKFTPPQQYPQKFTPPQQFVQQFTPPQQFVQQFTPPQQYVQRFTPPPQHVQQFTPPQQHVQQFTPPPQPVQQFAPPQQHAPPPPQQQQQIGQPSKMNHSSAPQGEPVTRSRSRSKSIGKSAQQGEPLTRARSKSIGRSASLKKKQMNGPYPQVDNNADKAKFETESGDNEPSEVPPVPAIPNVIPAIPVVPALPQANPAKQRATHKKPPPLKIPLNHGSEDKLKPVQSKPRLEAAYQAKPTIVNELNNYTYAKPSTQGNSIENQIHRQLTNSEAQVEDSRDSYYHGIIGGYNGSNRASVVTTDSLPDPNIGEKCLLS